MSLKVSKSHDMYAGGRIQLNFGSSSSKQCLGYRARFKGD